MASHLVGPQRQRRRQPVRVAGRGARGVGSSGARRARRAGRARRRVAASAQELLVKHLRQLQPAQQNW